MIPIVAATRINIVLEHSRIQIKLNDNIIKATKHNFTSNTFLAIFHPIIILLYIKLCTCLNDDIILFSSIDLTVWIVSMICDHHFYIIIKYIYFQCVQILVSTLCIMHEGEFSE